MLACAVAGLEGLHRHGDFRMHSSFHLPRRPRALAPRMQIGAEIGGELTYPFGLAARVGRDTFSDEWEEEEAYTPQWEMVLQPIRSSSNDPFQVARRVLPMLIAQTIWASGITLLSFRYQLWAPPMVHSLLGGVLGLLLAFRTNQAYLRYQQLCTTWVTLATHSLNMARERRRLTCMVHMPDAHAWTWAWGSAGPLSRPSGCHARRRCWPGLGLAHSPREVGGGGRRREEVSPGWACGLAPCLPPASRTA